MSTGKRTIKQNALQLYNGRVFGHKKEKSTDSCYNRDIEDRDKTHILCGFVYVEYPEQINLQRQSTGQWLPGAVGRGNSERGLKGKGFYFRVMEMVWN